MLDMQEVTGSSPVSPTNYEFALMTALGAPHPAGFGHHSAFLTAYLVFAGSHWVAEIRLQ
jgi:hypothetical protein